MVTYILYGLGVTYLIGFLLAMTALESYKRITLNTFLYHLGISLVWPFVLIKGLYQAYKAEK
jgi:hypothetical protein